MLRGDSAKGSRGRLLIAGLATALALLGAPAAQAIRYASPSGTEAESCASPATACDIRTAVEGNVKNEPAVGEQVVIEPGTYHVTKTIEAGAANMRIEGESGGARPVLQGKTGQIIRLASGAGTLAYLTVEQEGTEEGVFADGATLERLLVIGKPSGEMLCQCYDGLIRDSVFVAKSGGSGGVVGINSSGGTAHETLRNDTIYSEAKETPAIWLLEGIPSGSLTMNVINTIAVNTAGGHDVKGSERSSITLDHSAYASPFSEGELTDSGGRVTAAPVFMNAAERDFREQGESPTVDHGIVEAENGSFDLDGNARTAGATTDIGALEYQPPAPGPPSGTEPPPGGGSPRPSPAPETPRKAPVITHLRLSASVFRALSGGRAFASAHRPPAGARLTWMDSEPATTALRLTRVVAGHRTSRGCAAGKPSLHQRSCRRTVVVAGFTHADGAGSNSLTLSGRLHNRRLPPGPYALTLTPAAGGLAGAPVTVSFRIA